ncbi:MAG: hypothetical protein GX079_05010 [Tissierellia bacterium]|nr:hypothetical protein [Tissierellia bacterium]
MKKLLVILLVLVFMVSCVQDHTGKEMDKLLTQRYEEGDRFVLVEDMVEAPWDSVWLVNRSKEDMVLPADLEDLKPSDKVRIIVVRDGKIEELEFSDKVELKYSSQILVSAFQLYNDSEFQIDRVDEKFLLNYYEDCNV